jgi:hypothetical protein
MPVSPSRKLSVIGIIAGASALLIGGLAFTVPLLFAVYSMSSPRRMMHLDAHPGMIEGSMISWLIGAPIGTILVILGAPTLLFSFIIYLDTRRKEAIRPDQTTPSLAKGSQGS